MYLYPTLETLIRLFYFLRFIYVVYVSVCLHLCKWTSMCGACGSQKGVWIPWIWNYRWLWAPCGSWELILNSTNESSHLSNPSFLFVSLNSVGFYLLSVAPSQSAGFSDMAPSVLHWLPSSQCLVEHWAHHIIIINKYVNECNSYVSPIY